MKKVTKYILSGVLGGVLALCMGVTFIAGQATRKPIRCKGINVIITDSSTNRFVSEEDVRTFILRSYGEIRGKQIDSLNLARIEQIVDSRSAIYKSQAYVTRDRMLNISVIQRRPVVRFQKSDGGFYADAEGCIFPLQNSYASHVQIIDGEIPLKANSGFKGYIEDPGEMEWFKKVMNVVNFIENERNWRDKIVQIHVEKNGELILIPREGRERFLFGQPCKIEEKFSKMERYYCYIVPKKEEGYYKYVDLKYDGQIVCRSN